MKLKYLVSTLVIAGFAASAVATDGYISHGYGMTAKGMAGVATAMTKDSFGGANNPATMVWVGDRLDVGLDFFSPQRSSERSGSMAGIDGFAESEKTMFIIPEFGYNKMLSQDMAVGVSVYGHGGMNTTYPGGQLQGGAGTVCNGFNPGAARYNLLCGTGELGQNLIQLVISPTFSMKVNQNNSFGASLLIGYQKFAARGLDGFYGFTPAPFTPLASNNNLTNRGYDSSHGYGVRLGWLGRVSDSVTLGASFASKMSMSEFDRYRDLFAGRGYFDIPANLNLGISYKASPTLTVAADYKRVDYSGIKSVNNPSTNVGNASPMTGYTIGSLGCDNCRGFGWESVNVIKLGAEYQYNPNLILRVGYDHTDNPLQSRDVTFNILAPGVVQDHITAGFTYSLSKNSELTMAYMHAFKNSMTAPSLFNNWVTTTGGAPGGIGIAGNETINLYEDSIGIAYALKFQ